MSLPRKKTCRFFNRPGGCRNGDRCPDEHERHRQGRNDGPSSSSGRTSGSNLPRAPPGKCNFFWATGFCKRAFECKFQHVLSPTAVNETNGNARNDANTASEIPHLSVSELSDLAVSGGDAFRDPSTGFDPQQTQVYLARFLKEGFRFATPADMCSFAKLLSSASSLNKSWKTEDGQLFLTAIASETGCLLLSKILSFENVSSRPQYDYNTLSFQRGYLPVFQYLSSKFVVNSTLSHDVNAIYAVLHNNLERVLSSLEECVSPYMTIRSFKEKPSSPESSGSNIFGPIVTVFYEYLSRFKNALVTHKDLGPFILKLGSWIEEWANDIASDTPAFCDTLTSPGQLHARALVSGHIKDRMRKVKSIVEREQAGIDRSTARKAARGAVEAAQTDTRNLLRTLETYYEGPGDERTGGARHDNDFVDIASIKVAPTDDELTCKLVPFLPVNLPDAPHPFPKSSMQRLLDIQFRLLREELLAPLRTSVQVVLDDMQAPSSRKTQLNEIKKKKGGRYNYQDHRDSVMFNVYTSVNFSRIEMDARRGPVVEHSLDAPPGSARSNKANVRAAYWKNGKRLMQGGLVALLWRRGDRIDVHLGILCSSSEKLSEFAKANEGKLLVRIQFFDAIVNFKVLEHIRSKSGPKDERILVESSVMFETVRPFLESLKRTPERIPFSDYLPHPESGALEGVQVHPPAYSAIPNFEFNLECLHREGDDDGLRGHRLTTTSGVSIRQTRTVLSERSKLDPSQSEALVSALTKEVALIQGPPGTGKTFIGVELIRVLIKNNVGPILMIAFTNHALDHMLCSVIDSGITSDVVRLGGRSADETIKRYSIEELERSSGRSYFDRSMKSEYRTIKETEDEIMKLLQRVIGVNVPSHILLNHISMLYPDHVDHLEYPPSWILELKSLHGSSSEEEWKESGGKGKRNVQDSSLYAFWKSGRDLKFLVEALAQKDLHTGPSVSTNKFDLLHQVQRSDDSRVDPPTRASDSETPNDNSDGDDSASISSENSALEGRGNASPLTEAEVFLQAHGISELPKEPLSDRPLETLLDGNHCDVWGYSKIERARIDAHWTSQYRESEYESQKRRFEDLVEKHSDLRQKQQSRDEEIRLNIMRNRKLIGCTTTGAAKLVSLLRGLTPRVMIVEEAGQVLESHILASLVDSVQHLVLIGDPLQLRPTLNNFALSMDNQRGKELYRFDMSLMERLSKTKFPMSRLDVQRRMRPEISSLIRKTLYPGLKDHDLVLRYKSVRGMGKDVFFLSHGHQEHGGGDDSVSKHNPYEVSIIKDLVKYLLRQGCYSSEGSIVVLCTYLGQLARVRDSLKSEMTVVIDERDQDALEKLEGEDCEENGPTVERVHVTQRVKVRSVDNYQGEEADIVILSLVRNSGGGHETNEHDIVVRRTKPKIGFLKSENRTNVALSRARQGLYILGNAADFASQSQMWSSVVSQLQEDGAVGDAIPIKCHRHPEDVRYISKPGELAKVSPDGGCLRSCNTRLACGHNCPYKCHSDDENHRNVFCTQPCPKLCPKGHPCPKQCSEACGDCKHPIRDVTLPCGHVHKSVLCYQMDDLSEVKCIVKVERQLPWCEHKAQLPCFLDVNEHKCQALCDGILPCCGKSCKAKCHVCQEPVADRAALGFAPRTRHVAHKCGKPLYCEHACPGTCAADHKCVNECQEQCRQSCLHATCRLPCSVPCTPCLEPCTWNCPHYSCPVPCGSVCARLPCDYRCEKLLSCGHRCPSVCGEECAEQICLECTPKERLGAIADLIMQRPLRELDPSRGSIDELIITLPGCRHSFTVETLDGHCGLQEYYDLETNGTWRALKSPSPGFKHPPTCPTCRRAIRSPRYGRVYKRADLDILERNVASQLTRSIRAVVDDFRSVDSKSVRKALKDASANCRLNPHDVSERKQKSGDMFRQKVLNNELELPVPWKVLDPGKHALGLEPEVVKLWSRQMRELKRIYDRTLEVASARSAHMKAWDSAFSSLYRQEIENAVQQPAIAPRYPAEHAMRAARMKVGLSKPLADKRFIVEASWLTVDIRILLVNVAQEWLTSEPPHPGRPSFRVAWSSFLVFVLETCRRDARIALRIADASQSRKQVLRSNILIFNTELEILRLSLSLFRSGVSTTVNREELLKEVDTQLENLKGCRTEEEARHRGYNGTGMPDAELKRIFLEPMDTVRKELSEIGEAIRLGAVYRPLSFEEKRQIVAGLMSNHDLAYSGHFYQCSNGHPFVIGDCGGAMEVTRCPECYEQIGGNDHVLLGTNSANAELENIARANGALRSPWDWARF